MPRYLKIGKESTFNEAVAGTLAIPIISENFKLEQGFIRARTVAARYLEISQPGPKSVKGGFEFYPNYKNVGLILKAFFGSETVTQQETTTAYLHEFTPATGYTLPSLTVRVGLDDVAEKIISGYAIDSLKFEISPAELLKLTVDGIGAEETTGAIGTATFESGVITPADVSMTLGGSAVSVEKFSITMKNNLREAHQLGSRVLPRVEAGELEITGEFTIRFLNTDELNDFLNATRKTLQVKFEGDTIEGDYKYYLQIDVDSIEYDAGDANINMQERLVEDLSFTAVKGTGDIIKISLQNTDSSEY